MSRARRIAPRDLALTGAGLLLVLLWEVGGLDLATTRLFGDSAGFPLRDAWLTSTVFHQGGRIVAGLALALLAATAVRAPAGGPSRGERAWWLGVIVIVMLAVPALKRASATSCPWDLAEFGGSVAWVAHWLPGVTDGGPGHCFPSGHAVSAFAFFGLYFLWRPHRPALARTLGLAVLALGVAFSAAQLARGAHFVSHSLWSAWLAWAICVAASAPERMAPGLPPAPS